MLIALEILPPIAVTNRAIHLTGPVVEASGRCSDGSELTLRPIRTVDLPDLTTALKDTRSQDGEHFAGLGDPSIGAAAWLAWRLDEAEQGRSFSLAAFNVRSELVGEVCLADIDMKIKRATLSYWVRLSARRRGVGLKMACAICDHGFLQLGLSAIDIAVSTENTPSLRLARSLQRAKS